MTYLIPLTADNAEINFAAEGGGVVPVYVQGITPGASATNKAVVLDMDGKIDGVAISLMENAGTYVNNVSATAQNVSLAGDFAAAVIAGQSQQQRMLTLDNNAALDGVLIADIERAGDFASGVNAGTAVAGKMLTLDLSSSVTGIGSLEAQTFNAGDSANTGAVHVYSGTNAVDELRILATPNAGSFSATFTNASFAQSSVVSIPDPGVASSTFILADAVAQSQTITGDIIATKAVVGLDHIQGGDATHAGGVGVFDGGGNLNPAIAIIPVANTTDNTMVIQNSPVSMDVVVTVPDVGVSSSQFITKDITGGLQNISSNIVLTNGYLQVQNYVQSGVSGNAGQFVSFPATAAKGNLVVKATDNTNNSVVTITNVPAIASFTASVPASLVDTLFITKDSGAGQQLINNGLNVLSGLHAGDGNLQVGDNGTQGIGIFYAPTLNAGSLHVQGSDNGGFAAVLTNATMGQASTISLPDPGVASANAVLNAGTTTFQAGSQVILAKVNGTEAANAVTASGNAGVITTSALTTAAGASYAITWTNTKISTSSVIVLSVMGGTNTTTNVDFIVTAGAGTSTLTIYNNDPLAALNGTILIGYVVL